MAGTQRQHESDVACYGFAAMVIGGNGVWAKAW